MIRQEYRRNNHYQPLPEGVRVYGYRYQAVITTPTRTLIIGEYETIEEADQAYQDATQAKWNG